jgi:hypothetical protein
MYGILRKKDKGKGKNYSGIVLAIHNLSDMNVGGRSSVANDVTNPAQREVKGRLVP